MRLKKSFLPILIASVLLLSAASAQSPSPSPNPIPGGSSAQNEADQNKNTPENTASPFYGLQSTKQGETPTPINTPDHRAEKYERRIARSAVAQAACAVLLVLFTGLLACYGYRGWQATLIAANAAKKSADVSEQAFTLSERPWVIAEDWNLERPNDFRDTFIVKFNLRNFGRSPAWITKLRAKFDIIPAHTDFPVPPDYSSPLEVWHADARGKVIPPKESVSRSCPLERRHTVSFDYHAWEMGEFYFFVYGIVEYEDFSGNPHVTAFCAQHGFVNVQGESFLDARTEDRWYPDSGPADYHYHDRKKAK